ncbi:hypothetical protein GCM10027599_17960 [Yimella radicis]
MTLLTTARAGFAGTATLAAFAFAVAPAHAATTPDDAASAFMAGQLAAKGNYLNAEFGGESYPDYGLTIDALLGVAGTGTGTAQISKTADWLVANGTSYYGAGSEAYAGSLAKQVVMLQATGRPSGALLTKLKSMQTAAGRFSDKSEYGDYSNTIGQSWALIALKRSGEAVPTKAIDLLVAQQCADGGFRLELGAAKCTSDSDVTSFAVQALAANGRTTAVSKAAGYLATQQVASGGVRGGTSTESPNSNSAGLAAVAFTLAGRTDNAAKATAFVKTLQFGCSAPAALRGAIAYDKPAFDAKIAAGSRAVVTDQETRATPQAMLALTLTPYVRTIAGGSAGVTALDCGTNPTSSPTATASPSSTSSPSSSTSTTTSSTTSSTTTTSAGTATTSSSTSIVTGPPVVTDGPTSTDGGADLGVLAGVGAFFASICAGAMAHGRRRR